MLREIIKKRGDDNICTIRTSSELHNQWNKHFHRNPLYFSINADFEADNDFDNSSIGKTTSIICEQNPALNGFHIKSELNDILQSG